MDRGGRIKTTVCVDFDGVMTDYNGQWEQEHYFLMGAIEFLERLIDGGYEVVILTARTEFYPLVTRFGRASPLLKTALVEGVMRITNVKPPAIIYIDDRAYRFNHDFDAAFDAIHTPCWWEDKPDARSGWTPADLAQWESDNATD